jgi:hypothetical protein
VANVIGARPVAAKVPSFEQQVDRGDDPAVGDVDDRRVVAGPDKCCRRFRKGFACPPNQAEFPQISNRSWLGNWTRLQLR